MKRKENKKNYSNDVFEKKPKKHFSKKDRGTKRRLRIYDEFEDEDLEDYSFDYNDDDDPKD